MFTSRKMNYQHGPFLIEKNPQLNKKKFWSYDPHRSKDSVSPVCWIFDGLSPFGLLSMPYNEEAKIFHHIKEVGKLFFLSKKW